MRTHAAPRDRFDELKREVAQAFPSLSPQLRQIASYALENEHAMALQTVAQLAAAIGVQPSALVRFAQALGYEGFSDLQRVYQSRLVQRSRGASPEARNYSERIEAFRAGHPRTGPIAVLDKFIGDGIETLGHLHNQVRSSDLQTAVQLIVAAQSVYVLGQRRSFPVAYYLAYLLLQLDRRAQLLDAVGGMLREAAQQARDGDALIAISFRNYTPETVEIAAACRDRGVPVIAITDSALSPLARCAKVCFQIDESTSKPFRMLVAPMCLAQALGVAVGEAIEEGVRPARRRRGNGAAR